MIEAKSHLLRSIQCNHACKDDKPVVSLLFDLPSTTRHAFPTLLINLISINFLCKKLHSFWNSISIPLDKIKGRFLLDNHGAKSSFENGCSAPSPQLCCPTLLTECVGLAAAQPPLDCRPSPHNGNPSTNSSLSPTEQQQQPAAVHATRQNSHFHSAPFPPRTYLTAWI